MEAEPIIVLVSIAFGIFYLILLLKVWGMTNNVRRLTEFICFKQVLPLPTINEMVRLKMLGKEAEALEILNNCTEEHLIQAIKLKCENPSSMADHWGDFLKKIEPKYAYLGTEIPEKYKNFNIDAYIKEIRSL